MNSDFKAIDYIKACAGEDDSEVDAGKLAVAMVYDDHHGLVFASLERYVRHFQSIVDDVMERYRILIDAGSGDDVRVRLAALKRVIVDDLGYMVDEPEYEVLESVDMIRVIDRGKGCGAALGMLYIDAARKCGWHIEGLDVASHFLCRLEHEGERLIFDPAAGVKVMQAHDLRALVKEKLGEGAELSSKYLEGLGVRQCIVHLCNRLKLRRIEMGEYEQALEMIERMRVFVPEEYRLLLDAGVLYARVDRNDNDKAKKCLEEYMERTPNQYELMEAKALIDKLVDELE